MKNKNIKGETIKIESRRDLRNTIMHIISKYKNSDKMISLNDMKEIYGGIVKFGEKNYTKSLLRNCEKNIPDGYLTSLQRFIAPPLDVTAPYSQMLSKEDQQLLDYLKDDNSFLKAVESNKDKNQISEIEPISLDNFQNETEELYDKLIPNFQAEMVKSIVRMHEMAHKVSTKSSKTDEIFGSNFGEETTTTRKSGGKESRVTTHTVESTTTRIEDYDVAPGDNYIYEDGDSDNIEMHEADKHSSSVDNKEEVKERDVYQVADNIEKLLIEAGYENLADDLRNEIGFICPPELRWYRLNNFINNKVSKNPEDIYCVKIYSELVNKTEKEMKELMMQTTKQNVEPTIRENFILLENSAHTIYKEEKFGVVHERRVLSDGEGIISQTPDGKFYVDFDGTSTWVAEQELENGRIVKNTISCRGKWNGMPEEYNIYNVEMIKKMNNNL